METSIAVDMETSIAGGQNSNYQPGLFILYEHSYLTTNPDSTVIWNAEKCQKKIYKLAF
jgi:hypothetical protein